ncbi:uncharacterized protein [Setaria viridis]|uniref:uncharacterized protein n=1 Tax=Setaria viridis TaxID=4556 RepID=UPI0014932D19|nr:uncharacterized protein LOC117861702 [Setaria viridis]
MAYLVFPNGRMFRFPELTSSLPDKKAAGFLGAACDDWLLFHDDGGLFCLTSPFTGKTRLLPSFHGVRAHEGPVEIVNEPAPSLRAVTTQWKDDEAMAARKLVMCPDGGFIAAFYGGEHLAKVALCSLERPPRGRTARANGGGGTTTLCSSAAGSTPSPPARTSSRSTSAPASRSSPASSASSRATGAARLPLRSATSSPPTAATCSWCGGGSW